MLNAARVCSLHLNEYPLKRLPCLLIALLVGLLAGPALAQEAPQGYSTGNPVGVHAAPGTDQEYEPASSNVTVYGAPRRAAPTTRSGT
jgi:hypothetical protein